jgi:hypothetical protein
MSFGLPYDIRRTSSESREIWTHKSVDGSLLTGHGRSRWMVLEIRARKRCCAEETFEGVDCLLYSSLGASDVT